MKLIKLLCILIFTGVLIAPSYKPSRLSRWDKYNCNQLQEAAVELAMLYAVATIRLKEVKTRSGRDLWNDVRAYALLNRPKVLQAEKRNCIPS